MKRIKYTILTRNQVRAIFYTGTIAGGLMYSFSFWAIKHLQHNLLLEGLSYAGAVLLGGTITFCAGMLCKVDEESK